MEANEELVEEMVRASGLLREEVLALLGNAPFHALPTRWPPGLVEYLISEDPERIQTLATGAPGIPRPQSAQDRLMYNPHLRARYGYGLIIPPLIAGQPHVEDVPWARKPNQSAPDLEALVACLEHLEARHAHLLGSPAPSGKPVPLAACPGHRPELLAGSDRAEKWVKDGVRYSALAARKGTLADAAAAAQREELLEEVREIWEHVKDSKDVQKLLARDRCSDPVQRFVDRPNKAHLGPALRLAQVFRDASGPLQGRESESRKLYKILHAAGNKGVSLERLKSQLVRHPSKIRDDIRRSEMEKRGKIVTKIVSRRGPDRKPVYFLTS
jgi:hypothetical protein